MKQKVIIIIDDMSSSLEIMKHILAREGFEKLFTFDCPFRALHEIEQGIKPDIIITDYHMHEMNGLEFLESAISGKSNISAIIISGDTSSIENCPEKYIKIDKGDYDFFKKLLSSIHHLCQIPESKKGAKDTGFASSDNSDQKMEKRKCRKKVIRCKNVLSQVQH